jgi:hypothetical protein
MHCSRALYRQYEPCSEAITETCPEDNCQHTEHYDCHKLAELRASGLRKCSNKVLKTCLKCNINEVKIPCFVQDVVCNATATAVIGCQHEISWTCGRDTDPRLDPPGTLNCIACVILKWRNAIGVQHFVKFDAFEAVSRLAVVAALDTVHSEVVSNEVLTVSDLLYENHLKTRAAILKAYTDLLSRDSKSKLSLPPSAPGSVDDLSNYDIVYLKTTERDTAKCSAEFMKKKDTRYGFGFKVHLLTRGNLMREKPSEDGILRICVGLAYRHRCLELTPQFRASDEHADKKHSNRQMQLHKLCGFDCADIHKAGMVRPDVDDAAPPTPLARLYWHDYAVIPLCVADLKLHKMCAICSDFFCEGEGICCSRGHMVCWGECFYPFVAAAAAPDAGAGLVDLDGNMKCPHPGCGDAYNVQHTIDSKADREAIQALEELRSNARVKKGVVAALEQRNREVQLENERIQKIKDLDEREANVIKRGIVDDILSLRCPECKAVFDEFMGCFALTCTCRAGLCAWCLKSFGDDAHAHVPFCPERKAGGMFHPFDVFTEHHRARRQKAVQDIFDGLQVPRVKEILRGILGVELKDLKIVIQ